MKTWMIAFWLLLTVSSLAHARSAGSLFSRSQELRILEEISNLCGDSWCEGDFDYDFKEFRCASQGLETRCKLTFVMKKLEYVRGTVSRVTGRYPVSCEQDGLHQKSDVYEFQGGSDPAFQFSDLFLDQLNLCISDHEEMIQSGRSR